MDQNTYHSKCLSRKLSKYLHIYPSLLYGLDPLIVAFFIDHVVLTINISDVILCIKKLQTSLFHHLNQVSMKLFKQEITLLALQNVFVNLD